MKYWIYFVKLAGTDLKLNYFYRQSMEDHHLMAREVNLIHPVLMFQCYQSSLLHLLTH